MRFKKIRGVDLSYEKQGLVYFVCANYTDMPSEIREKIDQLCVCVGEEYYQALRDVLLCRKTLRQAAEECPCDERTLGRKRKSFFERW